MHKGFERLKLERLACSELDGQDGGWLKKKEGVDPAGWNWVDGSLYLALDETTFYGALGMLRRPAGVGLPSWPATYFFFFFCGLRQAVPYSVGLDLTSWTLN